MNILLTNDDGYNAPGILALYRKLSQDHHVTLVAPDREKSAVGHGISLNQALRLQQKNITDEIGGYTVNGTPADCVKLALFELFTDPPDLVVAGINPGSNTGVNINYSGTAAAAREAAFNRITGIAASIEIGLQSDIDFTGMAEFISSLVPKIPSLELPNFTFLNINCPNCPVDQTRGVKITCQAGNNVSENFVKKRDPKGRPYFWYDGLTPALEMAGTDIDALKKSYISISPLQCDTTDSKTVDRLMSLEYSSTRIQNS